MVILYGNGQCQIDWTTHRGEKKLMRMRAFIGMDQFSQTEAVILQT